MSDERSIVPKVDTLIIEAAPRGQFAVNMQVDHMTTETANARLAIARATHVEPVRTVMVFTLVIVLFLLIALAIVGFVAAHYNQFDHWVILGIVIAIAGIGTPLSLGLPGMLKNIQKLFPSSP